MASNDSREAPEQIFGDRQIHLHLGAHKTATTYLQQILLENRSMLMKQGVFYFPVEQMRKRKITEAVAVLSKGVRPEEALAKMRQRVVKVLGRERIARSKTILISEENLSTTPLSFVKGSGYSKLGENFSKFRDQFGPNVRVFFSIRSYPKFLASIYSEVIRNRGYMSFDNFLNHYGPKPTFWLEAYEQLVKTFGRENVTIWDFEDSVKRTKDVLAMLTGNSAPVQISSSPVREALSQAAVDFMHKFKDGQFEPVPPRHVSKAATLLYPLGDSFKKFDPWTDKQRVTLEQCYTEQVAQIPMTRFGS